MPRATAMLARVVPLLVAACAVKPLVRRERPWQMAEQAAVEPADDKALLERSEEEPAAAEPADDMALLEFSEEEQEAAEPADDMALLGFSEEEDADEGLSEREDVGSDDNRDQATKSEGAEKRTKAAKKQKKAGKGTEPNKQSKAGKAGKAGNAAGKAGQATGNPSARLVGSTGNSKTYDLTFQNPDQVNMNAIPAAYRSFVRSPDITGPGTRETARLWADAQKQRQTVFGLFYGAKYSDCARSVRLRTFWSNQVIDLSKGGCADGTILNEAENYGRFQGSMKFCMHSSGAPIVTMYEKPGCSESNKWHRSLLITGPQLKGIMDKYCIQVWAGGFFNAQLVNYKMSTGSMASC